MINRRTLFLAALSLAATAGTALPTEAEAHSYKLGNLEIGHPWSRATAPTAPTGAAPRCGARASPRSCRAVYRRRP